MFAKILLSRFQPGSQLLKGVTSHDLQAMLSFDPLRFDVFAVYLHHRSEKDSGLAVASIMSWAGIILGSHEDMPAATVAFLKISRVLGILRVCDEETHRLEFVFPESDISPTYKALLAAPVWDQMDAIYDQHADNFCKMHVDLDSVVADSTEMIFSELRAVTPLS